MPDRENYDVPGPPLSTLTAAMESSSISSSLPSSNLSAMHAPPKRGPGRPRKDTSISSSIQASSSEVKRPVGRPRLKPIATSEEITEKRPVGRPRKPAPPAFPSRIQITRLENGKMVSGGAFQFFKALYLMTLYFRLYLGNNLLSIELTEMLSFLASSRLHQHHYQHCPIQQYRNQHLCQMFQS
jgi:hypothetical protein